MPGDAHGRIGKLIDRKLAAFDPNEKLGMMWRDTTFDVGTGWMPIPDLGFMVAQRVPPESEKSVKGVPDLVVEIHSPGDLRSQPNACAEHWLAAGVRIVWAVNPRLKRVEMYHPGQSQPVQTLSLDDELGGEDVIAGFKMKVSELFA